MIRTFWFMGIAIALLGMMCIGLLFTVGVLQTEMRWVYEMLDKQMQINMKFYNDLEELKANQNTIKIELPDGAVPVS